MRIHELVAAVAAAVQGCSTPLPSPTPTPCLRQISGRAVDPDGVAVISARVTLTNEDASVFREVRTDGTGRYVLPLLPPGSYRLGVAALRRAFTERTVELQGACLQLDVTLAPETHPGRWDVIGDPGETFGGTDSGVLLPDGRIMCFSDELGGIVEIYDPIGDRWQLGANLSPVRSRPSILLLPDHRVLVLGGYKEDPSDPTPVNAWGQVKLTDLYDPAMNSWRRLGDLNVAREYHALPILVPDGRVR